MLLLCLLLGAAPELPPFYYMPRDKATWAQVAPGPIPVTDAYHENFPTMMARLTALRETVAQTAVLDDADVDHLLAELYVDHGHPLLNKGASGLVTDVIGELANQPPSKLPDGPRARLAEGFEAFVRAGGGRTAPVDQANAGEVMMSLSGDVQERIALADSLLTDALEWASAVDSKLALELVNRRCARVWGDSFWIDAADAELPPDFPAQPPKEYWKAIDALRELLGAPELDGREGEKLLRDAARRCDARLGDQRLNDDLLNRLLLTYRVLLRRTPPIPDRLAAEIERDLAKVAREGKLDAEKRWKAWRDATVSLRSARATEAILRTLEKLSRDEQLPQDRKRDLEHIRTLLRKSE